MAIQTKKDKDGKPRAFQAQIRIPGQKSESVTFATYEEAEEFERNAMRALRSARSVEETRRVYGRQAKPSGVVSLAAMKVSQVADEFASENPDHCYAPYANKVKEYVGTARVCDLDRKWTKAFCERMRATNAKHRETCFAEATIGQYIGMIRRYCNWKAESLGIERPRLGLTTEFLEAGWDDGRERRLRGNEEERLREELGMVGAKRLWKRNATPGARGKPWACARHYQLLFDFAIETCAREAEMVELPLDELDLEHRLWTLPAKRSKTRRKRKIYLTPRAIEILEELRLDRTSKQRLAFWRLPSSRGVSNTFRAAINRLDIEDLVFHDLRHEGITRHRLAGNFEPEVLMKMVGHSSPKMTMRYFNPEDDEILTRLEKKILDKHIEPHESQRMDTSQHAALMQQFAEFLSTRNAPIRL